MSKPLVAVLGTGTVGRAILFDLQQHGAIRLCAVDVNESHLARLPFDETVERRILDVSSKEVLTTLCHEASLLISAVPEAFGAEVLLNSIQSGCDIVDISFHNADFRELAKLAAKYDCRAAVDCGVAPGLSNILVGEAASQLAAVTEVLIYVGGLPKERKPPWEYKAVFSPAGVLAEYTRPVQAVEDGKIVTLEPLSECELLEFAGVGSLEAFNTDGLRTLVQNISATRMREKTLRYPGHAEKLALLRDSGFLSEQQKTIAGTVVRPIDLTAALLFEQWQMNPGDEDIFVFRVLVRGSDEQGSPQTICYDLVDSYDPQSGLTAMARTTGFTASTVARLLLDGIGPKQGLVAPECLGAEPAAMTVIKNNLNRHGIRWKRSVTKSEKTNAR